MTKRFQYNWTGWLAALFLNVTGVARAHDPGLSTAAFTIFPDRFVAKVIFARADIEALVPLDANGDGKVSSREWNLALPDLKQLMREALTVRVNNTAIAITEQRLHLDEKNNFHLAGMFPARGATTLVAESSLINSLPRGHRQFISLLDENGTMLAQGLLSADHNVIDVDLSNVLAKEAPPSRTGTFPAFFAMGLEHILTGYDHLLFLLGLLVVMSGFRATAWIITCFTLAHSTTLACGV